MLRSATGQPLDTQIASQMGSAFGRGFSQVRVHTDALAAQSAAAVGADAFTVGNDIVFAVGKYLPHSPGGARLLAHELTHVVQQRGREAELEAQLPMSTPGDAGECEADAVADAVMSGRPVSPIGARAPGVQRACSPRECGPPDPECTLSDVGVAGWAFMFKVGRDELLPGEEAKFSKLKPGSELQIHGFASKEGPSEFPDFNWYLSCHRANRIAELAGRLRPDCPIIGTFKHGPSPVPAPGLPPDVHPLSFWRTVIIQETPPTPRPPQPATVKYCGPDVTAWLINQMRANAKDIVTVNIRRLNRRKDLESRIPAFRAFYNMVKTGAPWDFKTLLGEKLNNITPCRTPNCRGKLFSVTLAGRCMTFEAPANIHFGFIGLHAGFSMAELLGGAGLAQMMELRWERGDDPKDTQAITKGFSLFFDGDPGKLTSTGLEMNFYENQKPGEGDPDGCDPCPTSAP